MYIKDVHVWYCNLFLPIFHTLSSSPPPLSNLSSYLPFLPLSLPFLFLSPLLPLLPPLFFLPLLLSNLSSFLPFLPLSLPFLFLSPLSSLLPPLCLPWAGVSAILSRFLSLFLLFPLFSSFFLFFPLVSSFYLPFSRFPLFILWDSASHTFRNIQKTIFLFLNLCSLFRKTRRGCVSDCFLDTAQVNMKDWRTESCLLVQDNVLVTMSRRQCLGNSEQNSTDPAWLGLYWQDPTWPDQTWPDLTWHDLTWPQQNWLFLTWPDLS